MVIIFSLLFCIFPIIFLQYETEVNIQISVFFPCKCTSANYSILAEAYMFMFNNSHIHTKNGSTLIDLDNKYDFSSKKLFFCFLRNCSYFMCFLILGCFGNLFLGLLMKLN